MQEKEGRIVSFYSYKGGTGRTMALTNIAWVLASNGYDVLVIDWDLEAPGLHRYLRPFLIDRELTATPGLIDFVWDCAQACMTSADGDAAAVFPTLDDYTVGLDWDFGERGSISFIPAGRQDDNYAQRVNTFNWDNFYERLGGGKILEAERQRLRAAYDYVLIDSRTGVSDTASICTVQMPDVLLVFFTLNRQSIEGTAAVAHSIQSIRPSIPIFPVPTRIENTETDKRDAAIAYARRIFEPFLLHVQTQGDRSDPQQQALESGGNSLPCLLRLRGGAGSIQGRAWQPQLGFGAERAHCILDLRSEREQSPAGERGAARERH
jgi:MinD-like ATPase involved in chromosome partitioning or flagellar assembly